MRRREHQSGFSTTVILLFVLVVTALIATSLVVYQHHKKADAKSTTAATTQTQTTTQPASTTTTQPAQATTQLATRTSTAGNFTFSYPSNWSVVESPVNSDTVIHVNPPRTPVNTSVEGHVTNNNTLSMSFWIADNPDVNGPPSIIPNGTTQKLTNDINLWTPTSATATHPTNSTGQTVCPVVQIVRADKTHLSYDLSNGKNLALNVSYCAGQNDTTSLTYQQQLSSSDWQAAIAIVQSIKFN